MTNVTIKPLTPADLNQVINIDKATGGVSRRGYFEKRLEAATNRPSDYVFVGLHSDGELAGFSFAKLVSGAFGQKGMTASLDSIGVDPSYRSKGYGGQLLAAVEDILRAKGVTVLTSQIDWSQKAIPGFFAHAEFSMAPRIVLTRNTDEIAISLKDREDGIEPDGPDYSSPNGDDENALSRESVLVRTMRESDLAKIITIDKEIGGEDRSAYFARKQHESLHQSGVQVSLVAEQNGFVTGFIMARVDFGEFGRTSSEAVMDTLGVDAGFQGQGIGKALMAKLMANLHALQVDTVRTEVEWNDTVLIDYFNRTGFEPAQRIVLSKNL